MVGHHTTEHSAKGGASSAAPAWAEGLRLPVPPELQANAGLRQLLCLLALGQLVDVRAVLKVMVVVVVVWWWRVGGEIRVLYVSV